jgi:6-phosphogluconolactonase (cycloisomerase 2 family)
MKSIPPSNDMELLRGTPVALCCHTPESDTVTAEAGCHSTIFTAECWIGEYSGIRNITSSGACLRVIDDAKILAHGSKPMCIAVDSNANELFVIHGLYGGCDKLNVFDCTTGELVRDISNKWIHLSFVHIQHMICSNGQLVLADVIQNCLHIVDAHTGACIQSMSLSYTPGPNSYISCTSTPSSICMVGSDLVCVCSRGSDMVVFYQFPDCKTVVRAWKIKGVHGVTASPCGNYVVISNTFLKALQIFHVPFKSVSSDSPKSSESESPTPKFIIDPPTSNTIAITTGQPNAVAVTKCGEIVYNTEHEVYCITPMY